ncbi:MAG TPA: FHA domain-containing protein [Fimbriimonadaceae bacterium]|nr:FHA domain-containing protein [Fimbriimonadaceae bacterium]HRJ32345.1 FHA domain-containing protein [Fimbriimonadaceae bacterium]
MNPLDESAPIEVETPEEPGAEQTPDAPAPEGTQVSLTLVRQGRPIDVRFEFVAPATLGRFDPATGPVDVDLGTLEPEGSYVSRKHAKITCEDGVYHLIDLGSSNGTFILRSDFERVEAAELEDGSEFALGNARFIFHVVKE